MKIIDETGLVRRRRGKVLAYLTGTARDRSRGSGIQFAPLNARIAPRLTFMAV